VRGITQRQLPHNLPPGLDPRESRPPSFATRVAALQKRRDRPRADLDMILDQGGVDMADLPGGASGLLARDYKGRKPIGW
jgi:hypothetical protein